MELEQSPLMVINVRQSQCNSRRKNGTIKPQWQKIQWVAPVAMAIYSFYSLGSSGPDAEGDGLLWYRG